MDKGFLGYPASYGGSARWYRSRTKDGFGGETLGQPNRWKVAFLDGYRCTSCRLVLMRY